MGDIPASSYVSVPKGHFPGFWGDLANSVEPEIHLRLLENVRSLLDQMAASAPAGAKNQKAGWSWFSGKVVVEKRGLFSGHKSWFWKKNHGSENGERDILWKTARDVNN